MVTNMPFDVDGFMNAAPPPLSGSFRVR